MSARKLCSLIHKSNKQIVTLCRRTYSVNVSQNKIYSHHYKYNNNNPLSQKVYYSQALGSLTKDQAHDLVFRLNEEERATLLEQLEKFQLKEDKRKLESQLAGNKWRSRFGRPSKVETLGEVVGGAYCKMPEDWLQKKIVAATPKPKANDLLKLCLINSLPFVGFGFLDNFTMIIAGDYIEYSVGTIMTISTMAAAALGNTISDVLGIGSAVYVERIVEVIGIKPPDLTPVQLEMKSARRASNFGRVFGIVVGCLLGMIPLMFMKSKEDEEKEATNKDVKNKDDTKPKNEDEN
ncbi:transmembrane protein 65 isoform X1 [Chironomus tepperi]|uniref:transmembrane protein 65 isoform X1 n=1 Tax=Chironomus tepperi TaxID=113505 RepID=UPI00391F3E10